MRRLNIGRPLLLGTLIASCPGLVLAPAALAAAKTSPGPPIVTTAGVSHVTGTSATLLGAVDPRTASTVYFFQYGPTTAYGKQSTPASLPAGIVRVKVGQAVGGLLPGYHYRLVGTNAYGTKLGADRTFTPTSSRSTKFVLSKPGEPTVFGSAFVLSGSLTGPGAANRHIVLQSSPYPYLTPFVTSALPIVTDATGHFAFHVATLALSTQFRVSTLDPRPFYSPILTQRVAVRVALKVRRISHNGLVRLYGTVTPAAVGSRLSIQLKKPTRPGTSEKTEERTTKYATQFSGVVKRATKAISRFSVVVSIRRGGRYRAFVRVNSGGFVSGSSPSIVLAAGSTQGSHKK